MSEAVTTASLYLSNSYSFSHPILGSCYNCIPPCHKHPDPGTIFSVSILTGSAISGLSPVLIVDTVVQQKFSMSGLDPIASYYASTSTVTISFEVSSSVFCSLFLISIFFSGKVINLEEKFHLYKPL